MANRNVLLRRMGYVANHYLDDGIDSLLTGGATPCVMLSVADMSLLDDWITYVADPGLFDPSNFEGVMLELDTPGKLDTALGDISNGFNFGKRLVSFRESAGFNGTYLLPLEESPQKDRMLCAERYRDSVSDRLREKGEHGEAGIVSPVLVEELLYDE